MEINTIIIDDERKSIELIKNKIVKYFPQIKVISETQSPLNAISLINDLKPELVILDIAMPELSGFDLLSLIPDLNFEIIFITAFDQYAIKAINYSAIGYLLKPIGLAEFKTTFQKAIKNIEKKNSIIKNLLLLENLKKNTFSSKKLVIPTQNGLEVSHFKNVIFLEGYKGYTRIYFVDDKSIVSSYNIGHYKNTLNEPAFYLVHKSFLINTMHIEKYFNEGYVLLTNGHKIIVSRNKKNDFLHFLKDN